MRMGIGLGVGINRSNYAQGIFSAYQSRVVADGGVTEAGACVDAVSGLLQTASLLLIPSGYKGGKLYSEIPTNGNGDFTWTRTSTAIRTNSSGLLESMGTGVPRLSYMYGSCPSALLEPQRTNSIRNSIASGAVVGTPGTTPTNWTAVGTLLGISRSISGIGTENGLSYVDITYSGTATATGTINTRFEGQGQIAVSNGQFWSLSTYLKNVSGTVPTLTLTMGERSSSAYVKFATQNITTDTSLNRYVYSRAIDGGATVVAVDVFLDLNIVNGQSYNFTIRVAQPQMELGAYATTPILTTGSATATRVADSFSRSNIYTNGLISASGGTWVVELRNNVAYTRDSSARLGVGDTTDLLTNSIVFSPANSGRYDIVKRISGSSTFLYSTATDTTKIAIKWNGSTADIFANGTKVVSATSFTTTIMENLLNTSIGTPTFIQQMALYPTPLTDAQCQTLTTL